MSQTHVATYLNDHLAGSLVGLELLGHMEKMRPGSALEHFAAGLKAEIEEDRKELQGLIKRLGLTESVTRQAGAWLAQKAAELKLVVDDTAAGPLRLLESTEALSLGIEGKRSLWRALAAASAGNPGLLGPDYARLEARAEDQRRRVEEVRMEAAREALRA